LQGLPDHSQRKPSLERASTTTSAALQNDNPDGLLHRYHDKGAALGVEMGGGDIRTPAGIGDFEIDAYVANKNLIIEDKTASTKGFDERDRRLKFPDSKSNKKKLSQKQAQYQGLSKGSAEDQQLARKMLARPEWAKKHIYDKTVNRIATLKKALASPPEKLILKVKEGEIPTLAKLSEVKKYVFRLGENTASDTVLQHEVNAQVIKLNEEYKDYHGPGQGITFKAYYGCPVEGSEPPQK